MTQERRRQLETKIQRYRRIRASFDDPQLTAGADKLVAEAEAELAALAREQEKQKPVYGAG